jgi:hypothetical protein
MAAGLCGLFTIGGIYAIVVMDPPSPGKAGLVVALFVVLMLFFLYLALRDAATSLELHQHGVVYHHGSTERAVRYADIKAVIERRFNGKVAQMILELRGGETVEIQSTLVDYDAAAEAIARAI